MRIKSIGRKGFTLAELLISAAITIVLVAIAIPVMKDALVSSKGSICYSNQQAATAEFSIGYVLGDYTSVISKRVLPEDMRKEYACPSGGTLFYEISATGDVTVTCSVHTDAGGGTQITVSQQDMDAVITAIKKITKGSNVSSIDSEAVMHELDNDNNQNYYADNLKKELKDNGIDFDSMGIKSWRVCWSGNYVYFEFTTAEIKDLDVDAIIPIIRYRPDGINSSGLYKGYSVWEAKVKSKTYKNTETGKTYTYNVIDVPNSNPEYSGKKYKNLSPDDKIYLNKIIDVYNEYNTPYPDIIKS